MNINEKLNDILSTSDTTESYDILLKKFNDLSLSATTIEEKINICITSNKILINKLCSDEETFIIVNNNLAFTLSDLLNISDIEATLKIKLIDLGLKSFRDILKINPFHKSSLAGIYQLYNKITFFNDVSLNILYFNDSLNYIPNNPAVHLLLGYFYYQIKDLDKVIYHYRLAISTNKDNKLIYMNTYNNIYMVYYETGKFKIAMQYALEALKLEPNDPDINDKLGVVYMKLNKYEIAKLSFEKAIENYKLSVLTLDSNVLLSRIYSNYAFCNDRLFDYGKATEFYQKSELLNPKFLIPMQANLMSLNYMKHSFEDRMIPSNKHRLINNFFQKTASYEFDSKFYKTPKINIGLVSGDFTLTHAVYFFLSTFLHEHSTSIFNVICYAENESNIPGINIKSTAGKSAKEASDMIYNDKIHILIDISGHTSMNRLDIFKNKPSPIQITYIGYPFTTGLNEMDYRITDQICEYDTSISQDYYTEKLLCLENCFTCYSPFTTPEITELPYDDYLNIGCYGRANKMSTEIVSLFNRILSTNSKVKLFFNSPAFRTDKFANNFLMKFSEEVRDRISFIKSTKGMTEHLLTLNNIHIQIDTSPYSSTTTACESFLMGVPMLTMYDTTTCYHCTNVTTSLLKNSDLDYYVCSSEDDLVNKIIELQSKPVEFWSNLKKETRSKFLTGKVCNKGLYLQNLTKMLVGLYDMHKITQPGPESLYQDFLNRDWYVNWNLVPLEHEELEMVIVEPRKHENLSRVITNFCSQLNQYPITWYCSEDNFTWLDDKLPEEALKKIKRVIFTKENITIYQYNELMTSPKFYDLFKSKRILIFQTDTGLLKSNIEDFLKYDYIGAGYPIGHATLNRNPQELVCGNGGLSLRNPKLMKRICENPNPLYNTFPEDFFFSNHLTDMSKVNKKICFPTSSEEANKFSCEIIIDNECFGFHNVFKYNDYDSVKELFE